MHTCRLFAFLCCWWLIKRWDFQKLLSFILNTCVSVVALVSLKLAVSGYQTFTRTPLLLYHARRAFRFMPVTSLTNTLHNSWQLRERQWKLSESICHAADLCCKETSGRAFHTYRSRVTAELRPHSLVRLSALRLIWLTSVAVFMWVIGHLSSLPVTAQPCWSSLRLAGQPLKGGLKIQLHNMATFV